MKRPSYAFQLISFGFKGKRGRKFHRFSHNPEAFHSVRFLLVQGKELKERCGRGRTGSQK